MLLSKSFKCTIKLGLIFLITLSFLTGAIAAQEETQTLFRLSGKHSFEHDGAERWRIEREEVDEKTGKSSIYESAYIWAGSKVTFKLKKTRNKETTYRVTSSGKNITRKFRIRVFEPNEVSTFVFESKGNPSVRTYLFIPGSFSDKTRIVFAMHGLNRNADDYIASWIKWAERKDHIVISPQFDRKNWKGSNSYNLGNMFRGSSDKRELRPRSEWSFQVVENIFDTVKNGFGLSTDYFDMFGHSAGGQFVHRFTLLMPDSRFRFAFAANSGWYTLPDLDQKFPYGLSDPHLSISKNDILNWTKKHVFILRGAADTIRDSNLRKTIEAEAQGRNRFERAAFMFKQIKAVNPGTNWRIIEAPTVDHDQQQMAVVAQNVLDLIDSQSKN